MAAPALPRGRGGAAAPSERGGSHGKDSPSHTSRHCACHVARVSRCRRKVPCGETRREVGEIPGMLAGRTGGVEIVEGSACPDHTRVCLRIAPRRGAGNVVGRSRSVGATMPRERHQGRVALAGGDRTMWARGYCVGTVGPDESVTGRHVRRQPGGSRTGWRECPRRGPAATATGPSRQCRCRDGPLWGVTEAPGYAGGSLTRAHLELGAGF